MTPQHATLAGALGIHAGLGRDRIELDLSTIPEDALSVAIRGDNGTGKSTLLNLALTPWREPPQIIGTIYEQFGPTGLRDLVWTHAGQRYWSRIEYKQTAKTKSQKATLKIDQDGAWVPVTLPDHTVSDGKSSTYDACLEHILGPQSLYYLAAFRAQNAPKLAEHDDPKGLMRALLDLDEPANLAEQAKTVARELKRSHAEIKGQADALGQHAERIGGLEQDIRDLMAGEPERLAAKATATEQAALAKVDLEQAVAGDVDRQRLVQQRAAVAQRLEQQTKTAASAVLDAQTALTAARHRESGFAMDAERRLANLRADLGTAQARVASAERTLAGRDAIAAAATLADDTQVKIAEAEQDLSARRSAVEHLRELASQVQALDAKQAHTAAEGKAMSERAKELDARAGFVAQVPCRGEGAFAACPALAEAKAAQGQIAEAQAAVEARRAEWNALNAQIKNLKAKTATLADDRATLAQAEAILGSLRLKLDAARATAAQASALALAEHHRTDALAEVATLTGRIAQAEQDGATQRTALTAEVQAAEDKLAAVQEDQQRAVAAVRAELDAIPEPDSDQIVESARLRLAQAETAVREAQAVIDTASAAQAQHAAEIGGLRRELDQGAATLAKATALESEIADWTLLALGLRGVIDLSIEDAGPGIAALANRLLTDAYGPRFSVRIVTQHEQANGVVRETFDISVLDAESGLESSVLQKSGGESVWLDKALTDAVALYHQEAAGRHYECLFADEAEDGLTQERKQQFYCMDRAALELGRYQRKFFISHNPDAWALADHVIDLAAYRAL